MKKSIRSTLFDLNWHKHAPKMPKGSGFYPYLLKDIERYRSQEFGGSESSAFADVLDHEYGLYTGSHTQIAGPLKVRIGNKSPRFLGKLRKGFEIPDWVEDDNLKFLDSNAKGILLIETHTAFYRLVQNHAPAILNMILVTGMGIPRLPTRRLLHRIAKQFSLPVYVLTDNSTFGYFIFSVLKRGMLAPHATCPFAAIPNVHFLGLRAGDYSRFGIDRAKAIISWKNHWNLRIKAMAQYPCFKRDPWRKEFAAFKKQRGMFELACITGVAGVEALIQELRTRVKKHDYLS